MDLSHLFPRSTRELVQITSWEGSIFRWSANTEQYVEDSDEDNDNIVDNLTILVAQGQVPGFPWYERSEDEKDTPRPGRRRNKAENLWLRTTNSSEYSSPSTTWTINAILKEYFECSTACLVLQTNATLYEKGIFLHQWDAPNTQKTSSTVHCFISLNPCIRHVLWPSRWAMQDWCYNNERVVYFVCSWNSHLFLSRVSTIPKLSIREAFSAYKYRAWFSLLTWQLGMSTLAVA